MGCDLPQDFLILAIETSCDETAAAIVRGDGEVLSNIVATQIPIHARYGGVVPELASRNHLTALQPTVARALTDAGVALSDLKGIAVTARPGLAGCLLVGLQTAKSMAYALQLPLIPVDHVAAHIHAIFLRDVQRPQPDVPTFPYVALAVSGGHTSLARVDAPGQLTLLGQTVDDAAGEAFDKAAKMMGLPYPGGVQIDRLALDGATDAFAFPRPMLHAGLDFSFSGLKTAIRYTLRDLEAEGKAFPMHDLAASFQEAIVDCLIKKSLKACRETGLRELVLAGGVACNTRLRAKLAQACTGPMIKLYATPPRYCTDNAAMIGGLGVELFAAGRFLEGEALMRADITPSRRPQR